MPIQTKHQSGAGSHARFGPELRGLFEPGVFAEDGTLVPRHWHPLPDFRPSVQEEGLDLLQGRTAGRHLLNSCAICRLPMVILSRYWSFGSINGLSAKRGNRNLDWLNGRLRRADQAAVNLWSGVVVE